jgi:hypothetical protein
MPDPLWCDLCQDHHPVQSITDQHKTTGKVDRTKENQ